MFPAGLPCRAFAGVACSVGCVLGVVCAHHSQRTRIDACACRQRVGGHVSRIDAAVVMREEFGCGRMLCWLLLMVPDPKHRSLWAGSAMV
jgi:hypothetical protein